MASIAKYNVVKRTAGSNTVPPEYPNTLEYTYVASALDTAIALLSTEAARAAMCQLAVAFDRQLKNSPKIFQGASLTEVRSRIDGYVQILQQNAPIIVIDGNLTDPRIQAFHPRGVWDTNFDITAQAVMLNRKLVEDMANASETPGAHLLMTYLYHGRPVTPKEINHDSWVGQAEPDAPAGEAAGESGRFFEGELFGGTVENFDIPQRGTPWLVDGQNGAKKITQATIDATTQRNFILPYTTEGELKNVYSLVPRTPQLEIEVQATRQDSDFIGRARAQPRRFVISRAQLQLVPSRPDILAQEV
ncbi:hypothetical protein FQN54_004759 [Arachnomyces sp. PD_36]|nr:hypothetical protein FQN54_004759 [Arachnomyces sp. PD_36]